MTEVVRRSATAWVLGVLVAAAAGCAGPRAGEQHDGGASTVLTPSGPAAGASPFVGTYTAVGATGVTLTDGAFPVRLELSGATIAATAGCRMMTGSFTTDGTSATAGELTGADVVTEHEIRCADNLNALDGWLAALLDGPMAWAFTDTGLTVTAGDTPTGSLTLERVLSPSAADPTTFSDPGLAGTYALNSWSDYESALPAESAADGAVPAPPPRGPTVRMTFGVSTVTSTGACGVTTGDYRLTAGALAVSDLATTTTDGACEPRAQEFDDLVARMLAQRPLVRRQGDGLAIESRDARFGVQVSRIAEPADPDFGDRTWTLVRHQRPGADPAPVPAGVTATLRFHGGRLEMTTGCNAIGAMAWVADGVIRVRDFSMTAMLCDTPAGDTEAVLIEPFSSTTITYRVDGDTLSIIAPTMTLVFTDRG
ncbi:MAG: META domain-containing protein [Nakamurella sp.]